MKKILTLAIVTVVLSGIGYAGVGASAQGTCWPTNASEGCDVLSNIPSSEGSGTKKTGGSCGERYIIDDNGRLKRENCGAFNIVGSVIE